MKSRLVFKDKDAEGTNYQWNKYNTNRGRHFIFDKYELISTPFYKWKKSEVLSATDVSYIWDKYNPAVTTGYPAFQLTSKNHPNPTYTYYWNRKPAVPAGTTFYEWDLYKPNWQWADYSVIQQPIYEQTGWGLTGKTGLVESGQSDDATYWGQFTDQWDISSYPVVLTFDRTITASNWSTANKRPNVNWLKSLCDQKKITVTTGTNGSVDLKTGKTTINKSFSYKTTNIASTYYKSTSPSNQYSSDTSMFRLYNFISKDNEFAKTRIYITIPRIGTAETHKYFQLNGIGDEIDRLFVVDTDESKVNTLTVFIDEAGYTENADNTYTLHYEVRMFSTRPASSDTYTWTYYETTPSSSVITGYKEVIGSYLGDLASTTPDTYPENGVYTTAESTSHWAVYQQLVYGEKEETYRATNGTAKTATNLAMSYYSAKNIKQIVGPRGQTITTTPEIVAGAVTSLSSSDPNAYPINTFGVVSGNTYYFEFLQKQQDKASFTNGGYIYVELVDRYLNDDGEKLTLYKSPDRDSEDTVTIDSPGSNSSLLLSQWINQGYRWVKTTMDIFVGTTTYSDLETWGYLTDNAYYSGHTIGNGLVFYPYKNTVPLCTWSGWHLYIPDTFKTDKTAVSTMLKESYIGLTSLGNQYLYYANTTDKPTTAYGPGEYVTSVGSKNKSDYPVEGMKGNFYYRLREIISETEEAPGAYIEDVTAYTIDEYPDNGKKGDYWYQYIDSDIEYSPGTRVDRIMTIGDSYPHDGPSGGYYYKYVDVNEDTYPGLFIEEVYSDLANAWPQNGEAQDGYYYIYIGKVPKVLYSITNTEIKSGVDYSQNINSEDNLEFGVAAAASISLEVLDTEVEAQKYLGLTCDWYTMQGNETTWKLMGSFIINDVQHSTSISSKLSGFDNISLFDVDIEEWMRTITYPISLGNLFTQLCSRVGAQCVSSTFINSDFQVYENASASGITGRQLLSYICQAAGGFARATADGKIEIANYSQAFITLDSTKYSECTLAIYNTPKITKLTIKGTEEDLGTTIGDGDSVYQVVANPLLFVDSESQLDSVANNLFKILKDITYTPGSISLYQDFNIKCGDIITIDGNTFYVMEKSITSSGVELQCFGQRERTVISNQVNSELIALRGKTNELTRTLDKTNSTLTDNTNKLQSSIEQTASSLEAKITQQGNEITSLKLGLDGISMSYDSANGTASITIGDVTVSNLVDGKYVSEAIAGITLTGYVTFNDLKKSGSTTINGDNITTGTISADRLALTGSIAWGDLSSSAKEKIIEYAEDAAAGVSDIPSYIHSTYIDSTNIYSPNIYGAKITAGSSADGYIQMGATGMNFKSNSGGSLIGMGYYPGKYNYPYFVLGGGVDSAGTDRGMVKKFSGGIWIGDSDSINEGANRPSSGTGIFVDFAGNRIYKVINGSYTQL